MTFGFIIACCIRTDIQKKQLIRCIDSIRSFHVLNPIILINDSLPSFDLSFLKKDYFPIEIVESSPKGSADQQFFKILLDTTRFDKAIFLQDSMILNKKLENIESIQDITFLWHFTNHRLHWDIIQEESTPFNNEKNIHSHTDLIKYYLKRDYSDNGTFLEFALDRLNNKGKWVGCFGNLCIITKEQIYTLEKSVRFVDKFCNYTNNRERRVNETIFSILCHYCNENWDFSKSYDGLYTDGINTNIYAFTSTGFDDLLFCCKNNFFSKISFNR